MPKGSAKRAPHPLAAKRQAVQAARSTLPALAGMDLDVVWRDFLVRTTGKRSLREMNEAQLDLVLATLHGLGAPGGSAKKNVRVPKGDAQSRKLLALWIVLGKTGALQDRSDRALCAWAAGELGLEKLDSLGFLASEEKHVLIDRLKAWCRRAGAEIDG